MKFLVRNPVEKFCFQCLAFPSAERLEKIRESYPSLNDNILFEFAKKNRIESIVGSRLKEFLNEKTPPHWIQSINTVKEKLSAYMEELDSIAEKLSQAGISLVALKNAGIARGIYNHLAECPMGDIDVLIDKSQFLQAHQVFEQNGYQLGFQCNNTIEKAGLEEGLKSGGVEYQKLLPSGHQLWVELQWRPVSGRWLTSDKEVSSSLLLARSEPINGTKVRLLAPQDNLLQVCLHTAKHSYLRAPGVRLHTDVDRLVNVLPIDWSLFVQEVKDKHVKVAVYFSLAIPSAFMSTPMPSSVLDALKPNWFHRTILLCFIKKAGLFNPDAKKFGKLEYIAFNCLLFDNAKEFLKALFPSRKALGEEGKESGIKIGKLYFYRLWDLLFRRVKKV